MVCIVYAKSEETSKELGERVVRMLEPEGKKAEILALDTLPIFAEGLDKMVKTDLFIFLSRHRSSMGVASFTIHPLGNWAPSSDAGGKPRMLSMAAPWQMRNMLVQIYAGNKTDVPVTYEATHHGPFLETPSFFVEVGGSEKITEMHYDTLAGAVCDYVSSEHENVGRVAVAIGGTHYPEKFTKLAIAGKYSFSHIMPRHSCIYSDMLEAGINRSVPKAECAVIDWKGIAAPQRDIAIKKLGELGVDYVRV
jgi:D-aminoacyl-tRNA deacylase